MRIVQGDAADGGVPRSVRLPDLRLQRSAGFPQRAPSRWHERRPPRSCRFKGARREGDPSRRLRLLRASLAPPKRVVIAWGTHLLVERAARAQRAVGRSRELILSNAIPHGDTNLASGNLDELRGAIMVTDGLSRSR